MNAAPDGAVFICAVPLFRPFNSHWIYTMYRCALTALAAFCAVAPAALHAQAAQRSFPQNALRGVLVIQSPFEATLNGQAERLAPGVRIRAQNNMLAMSGSLIGSQLSVNYTQDTQGLINNVWILTAEEAAKTPWPTTPAEAKAWRFDPVAQVWSKP